jgi:hypothetical protein
MGRILFGAALLSLLAGSNGVAQSSPDTKAQSDAKSAQAAQAPASQAAKDQAKGKEEDKKKPKKVWTEEEISKVGGNVSVVGDGGANASSRGASSRNSTGGDVSYYRNRLEPLRHQIADIDREIQDMRSVKGTVRENVEQQVQIRENKKAKLQAQVDAIEEEARQHGISAGELR